LLGSSSSKLQSGSPFVDLALVIALDISGSVDKEEFGIMRTGLANALSSQQLSQAIKTGKHGSIAVTVVQWAGYQEQVVKVAWTRIENRAGLLALARKVRAMTRRYGDGATHIGGVISYSADLIMANPFRATRKIIDIAGDGKNNVNFHPDTARDPAVEAGITINALVITGDLPNLDDYFHRFVIGGASAFVEPVGDFAGFERGMHRKLLREIVVPLS